MTNEIKISAPRMMTATFHIRGTTPLMTARFSKKAELMEGMQAPATPGTRKKRTARNYVQDMEDAAYLAAAGWYGMNATAFRKAAISACRLVGFKMTIAKLSIFTLADGSDKRDATPLIRITLGEPLQNSMHVRNATGVIDIRVRPLWEPGWEMLPRIRWDLDQFSLTDITNLMSRVGEQVGIGEGRPDSRDSAGLGYGLFELLGVVQGK